MTFLLAKKTVKESTIVDEILAEGKTLSKNLLERADKNFEGNIHDAKTMEELKANLDKGGFVRINFCTISKGGKACEDQIKEACGGGKLRGLRADKQEKPEGKCIVCDKPATCKAYVARQY